ncbi:hypothetical protein GN156_13165 [bacterium LRH843]|nr:hypothetical protein [bacterium LRH843]
MRGTEILYAIHSGDCFGFIKQEDLTLCSQSQQKSFSHHKKWVSTAIPIDPEKTYTKEELRQFIPGAGRLMIGCVTENTPKFIEQTLKLVHSIRSFAGNTAGVNLFVCIVEPADQWFVQTLQHLGVFVRLVPRYNQIYPFANKFRVYELPEIQSYDTFMFIDCDTVSPRSFSIYRWQVLSSENGE